MGHQLMERESGGFSPRTAGHVCRVGLIACPAAPLACSVLPPSEKIVTLCLCDVMTDEICEYSFVVAMQLHSCGHRSSAALQGENCCHGASATTISQKIEMLERASRPFPVTLQCES
eukprot:5039037-Pleurochrysis_carterae.AAC.1